MTKLNFECFPTGLKIKGQLTGKAVCTLASTQTLVLFGTPHTPRHISGQSTVSSLQAILYAFLLWVDAIKAHSSLDPFQSVVFAVLEGLAPERGPTTREVRSTPESGDEDTVEVLPLWLGPYDYSSRKQDFLDCCELLDILGADIPPGAKVGATLIDVQLENLLEKVKTKKQAFKYFTKACDRMSADRRGLFVLSSGMVGTGPLDMREGDEVFLLAGVPAPMVLRLVEGGNAFRVVGSALVHGMMRGEIFQVDKLEDITLK